MFRSLSTFWGIFNLRMSNQNLFCLSVCLFVFFVTSWTVEETSWAMFEFPTSFCKMRGNDPRRCLTLRLTSVLLFGSLWLPQGKLQWPEQLRLYQHRHRARFSTWRSSIPKWRILFFTSANQWSCLTCILFHTVPRPIALPNFQS